MRDDAKMVTDLFKPLLTAVFDVRNTKKDMCKVVDATIAKLLVEINNAEARGKEHVVEYIRAEGEWVKEDVADGNYGYFRADEKILEEAVRL